MILIKCCAICRYYREETCMSPDSMNTGVTPDDWCPAWEEYLEKSDEQTD